MSLGVTSRAAQAIANVAAIVMLAAWQPWDWSPSAWAALTFLVLAAAAIFGWRQVKELRRAREEQTRPFVVLDLDMVSIFAELHVRNIGATMARDVRFEFDKRLETTVEIGQDWSLPDLSLFKDGIPSLAPGRVIKVLFDHFPNRFEKKLPLSYTVAITYTDSQRRHEYTEQMVIDLNPYVGTNGINRDGLHEIHAQLKDLVKTLDRWTDSEGLRIVTSADQEERAERWRARLAERQTAAEIGAPSDRAADSEP